MQLDFDVFAAHPPPGASRGFRLLRHQARQQVPAHPLDQADAGLRLGLDLRNPIRPRCYRAVQGRQLRKPPLKCSVTSRMRSGLRRSGLSEPNSSIAWSKGMRGKGAGVTAASCRRIGEFLEHAAQNRLDRGEDVFLGDEAHLEVELVELAGLAVGAARLVAEAGRDLEVAVEAGDHGQLLELLRRLRQGVEVARDAAGTAPGSRARLRGSTPSGSASGTR